MFGLTLILALALMGGVIAFLGDRLGYKFGKKRLSFFGLRPRDTSTVIAVCSGIAVAALTLGSLSVVSQDVRTALFGMDKLKARLAGMADEVQVKNSELAELQQQFEQSSLVLQQANIERDRANEQLGSLEAAQAKAEEELARYRKETDQLEQLRDGLQKEVGVLQEETEALEQGLIRLREGQVVFRAGQIIYEGVLRGGQSEQYTVKSLTDFLSFANSNVAKMLGVQDVNQQLLFVSQANFNYLLEYLLQSKEQVAVRLQAAGNIIAGEPVMAELHAYPNKLLYPEKKIVHQETVPASVDKRAAQAILLSFLSRLNSKVVAEGLLPDPITGNVGDMDLPYVMEIMEKISATQGNFSITAVASQDIYTLGPLRINIIVKDL